MREITLFSMKSLHQYTYVTLKKKPKKVRNRKGFKNIFNIYSVVLPYQL